MVPDIFECSMNTYWILLSAEYFTIEEMQYSYWFMCFKIFRDEKWDFCINCMFVFQTQNMTLENKIFKYFYLIIILSNIWQR